MDIESLSFFSLLPFDNKYVIFNVNAISVKITFFYVRRHVNNHYNIDMQ